MNVLYITDGMPYPPNSGSRLRDWHMLRQIGARHTVHLLVRLQRLDKAQFVTELRRVCASVEISAPVPRALSERERAGMKHMSERPSIAAFDYVDDAFIARMKALLAQHDIDLVQVEHAFLAPCISGLSPEFRGVTVLDMHNVGSQQYRRIAEVESTPKARFAARIKSALMVKLETHYAAKYDRVIVVSEAEAEALRAGAARADVPLGPACVVENGVDSAAMSALPDDATANSLLFVGALSYEPNVEAMTWFCDEILPLIRRDVPDVVLRIVGRAPSAEVVGLAARANVSVVGQVDDVTDQYRAAKLVVVPLRAGGGTRLKILEAMALGRAVVSTSMGAEGIAARDGEHIALADAPADFAARVVALLRDRPQRARLARNARNLVEARYDWAALGQKLLAVYDDARKP